MSETTKRLGYAVGGFIAGGVLAYAALAMFTASEDEDRPPIIVRGGSIIFQSGDPQSGDPDETAGRAWISYNGDWQPDHREGKKSKWFTVQILGATSCPALSLTRQVTVTYTIGQTSTDFVIGLKGRPGTGSPAPALTGTGLTEDNSGRNPTLTYGTAGQGRISRVRFQAQGTGNVDCVDPTSLKIWIH